MTAGLVLFAINLKFDARKIRILRHPFMDRGTQFATELQTLRTLCDESIPREDRQRLLQSLVQQAFTEPEHQVVFESIRALLPRGPISAPQLRVHLNNRGFCDTDVEAYFQPAVAGEAQSEYGFGRPLAISSVAIAALVVLLFFYGRDLRGFVRESLMQRVTSAHYEILCPADALPQSAMSEFATHRERLFARLNKKLGDAESNLEIRVILDPDLRRLPQDDGRSNSPFYSVSGTTIRTKLNGQSPQLPGAADAEALLYAAWGKPGNAQIARWTSIWLVGDWSGAEIGMAAAQVEQRLGHKKVASVLVDPGGEIASPDDRALLGAAWISQIAEFGGADAVRKLYSTKMPHPSVAEVANTLGTTPLELDRKWQLWMYAYLAGMPAMPQDSGMPMDMPMAGSH